LKAFAPWIRSVSALLAFAVAGIGGGGFDAADASPPVVKYVFAASLFPATLYELETYGDVYLDFGLQVSQAIAYDCMKAKGYTTAAELGSRSAATPDNGDFYTQFPAIKLYESGSFDIPKPIPAPADDPAKAFTPHIPLAILSAWRFDSAACDQKGNAPIVAITKELDPIFTIWANETGPVDLPTVPPVAQALDDWRVCVGEGGFPSQTLGDFINTYLYQDIAIPAGTADINDYPQVIKLRNFTEDASPPFPRQWIRSGLRIVEC
jgi:hypothetical protein